MQATCTGFTVLVAGWLLVSCHPLWTRYETHADGLTITMNLVHRPVSATMDPDGEDFSAKSATGRDGR